MYLQGIKGPDLILRTEVSQAILEVIGKIASNRYSSQSDLYEIMYCQYSFWQRQRLGGTDAGAASMHSGNR